MRDVYGRDRVLVTSYGKPRPGSPNYNIALHFLNRPHPQWARSGYVFPLSRGESRRSQSTNPGLPCRIFITEDTLAWGEKQPVDPHVIKMTERLLWPAPAVSALWRFSKTITTQTFGYLFGFPESPPPSPDVKAYITRVAQNTCEKRAQTPLQFRPQLPGGPGAGPPTADPSKNGTRPLTPPESRQHGAGVTSSNVQGDGAAARKDAARKDATEKDATASSSWTDSLLRLHSDLLTVPTPPMRDLFPSAWRRLMLDLRAIGKREPRSPPPGCVGLSGLVAVRTNTHLVVLRALAFYDPKVDDFDRGSAKFTLKEIRRISKP